MHELSIAMSVIEVVTEELRRQGHVGQRVLSVRLSLGPLAGVSGNALLSAFEIAREGTALAGAEMVIKDAPLIIYCPKCSAEKPAESVHNMRCAACGSMPERVVRGDDMQITTLEMDDDEDPAAGSPPERAEAQ